MQKSRFKGLIVTLVTLVLCLLLAEVALRIFAPVRDPYAAYKYIPSSGSLYIRSQFPPDYRLVTQSEPNLPGMEGQKLFTTNNMGFRGDPLIIPKPEDEFRIFMIGGSTTECLYLDDSEAIHSILQRELNKRTENNLSIKVYNAGKSGDASDDHVSMLVHRLVHLEPDMIIVFTGVNDLTRAIYKHDYLHYPSIEDQRKHSLILLGATEFQVFRRIYYLLKRYRPTPRGVIETITQTTNYREKVALRKSVPVSDAQPRTDLKSYEQNLLTIAGVMRAHGIQLVYMTQQTTWNSQSDVRTKDWHWMLYRNGVHYREDIMHQAMESLNDVMREIAREDEIPCYDLARDLPKSLDLFYDDVHFNVRGAETAGVNLADHIFSHQLIQHEDKGADLPHVPVTAPVSSN